MRDSFALSLPELVDHYIRIVLGSLTGDSAQRPSRAEHTLRGKALEDRRKVKYGIVGVTVN